MHDWLPNIWNDSFVKKMELDALKYEVRSYLCMHVENRLFMDLRELKLYINNTNASRLSL